MNHPINQNEANTAHYLRLYFTLMVAFLFITVNGFSQKKKKNSLAGHAVTGIEIKYDEKDETTPGSSFQFGISALLEDGSIMTTNGFLKGKVKWNDFDIEVLGGTRDNVLNGGTIKINSAASKGFNHSVKIIVSSKHHPKLTDTVSIAINYNIKCVASFNGTSGADGNTGNKGDGGGTDGSIYDKSYGTDGKDGRDGGNGGDGKPGKNATGVKVYLTTTQHKIGKNTLVQAVVTDANGANSEYFVFDPTNGSLSIYANGGEGGRGGAGGAGGSGGKGQNVEGSSEKKQTGGNGGDGGNGGSGGSGADGGDGGTITIYYDSSAEPFLNKISTSNNGGRGGSGGSGGSGGDAGIGGNGYNSGKHGTQGKSGSSNSQKGNSGNDGPAVSKIKQTVDLKQFGIE